MLRVMTYIRFSQSRDNSNHIQLHVARDYDYGARDGYFTATNRCASVMWRIVWPTSNYGTGELGSNQGLRHKTYFMTQTVYEHLIHKTSFRHLRLNIITLSNIH